MLNALLASVGLSCALLVLPLGPVGPLSGSAGLSSANASELEIDDGDGDEEDAVEDDDDAEGTEDEDDDEDGDPRTFSCQGGKRVVARAGYRDVRVRDCTGKNYRYIAHRKGYEIEVVVSRFGRILNTRRRD
jgi:hypothetical protein